MAEPTFSNVKTLLPLDSNFTDQSNQSAFTTTGGSVSISTATKKYGAGSAEFPSGSYVSLKAAEFGFDFLFDATAAFTLQMWVNPDAIGSTQTLFYSGGIWFGINASGELELAGDNGGSVVSATSTGTISAGAFTYVELSRDSSGDWRIFLGGTLEATQSESGNVSTAQVSYIGQATLSGSDRNFVGFIDDVRLTDGETLNTATYTPPTEAHATGAPTFNAYLNGGIEAFGLLGIPQGEVSQYVNPDVRLSSPTMLGAPSAVSLRAEAVSARVSVPSILGAPRLALENDFSLLVTDPTALYVLKITGEPEIETPISSWQSTIQSARASFLQVVIPAYTPYAEELALRQADQQMIVFRRITVNEETADTEIARAGMDTIQFADGSRRSTATIQGYTPAFDGGTSGKTVVLENVRTAFTTVGGAQRVRCDINWLLRPGQTVANGGDTFEAQYINYFVPSIGDSYMDVGDRG